MKAHKIVTEIGKMAKDKENSRWPIDVQPILRMVDAFLATGQYEQAAEILPKAQLESEQRQDEIFAAIQAAARRICLACIECRGEAERYQEAYEETLREEGQLKSQLRAIVDSMIGRKQSSNTSLETKDPIKSSNPSNGFKGSNGLNPAERNNKRQSKENMLAKGIRSLERLLAPKSANEFMPSSSDKAVEEAESGAKKRDKRIPPV